MFLRSELKENFLIPDENQDGIEKEKNEEINEDSKIAEYISDEEAKEAIETANILIDSNKSQAQNTLQIPTPEIASPKKEEETIPNSINGYNQETGVDLSQLSCLYIEDQIDSQILFSLQMKDLADIKYAVSFEEALPLLNNNKFDFILIDINILGEYNGLDALRMIHRLPDYEKLPIIAVTSYVLPGDQDKFIAAGFNDFISKPIFREKVIASLDRIFLMQF
jgi:CheY-like chemotaxis protein